MLPFASLVCLILCAFLKAVVDTVDHHSSTSIFRRLNPNFWDHAVSSQTAPTVPLTHYKWDAWHLGNSAIIACAIIGAILHRYSVVADWHWAVQLTGGGLAFIGIFNTFYNHILLSHDNQKH